MVLVFGIALFIVIFLFIIIAMIYFSKLEIKIQDLEMSNINKRKNNEKILIQISLKIGKIHWLKIKLNKEKLANVYAKMKRQEYKINKDLLKDMLKKDVKSIIENKEFKEMISDIKIELEKINASVEIGTEDYIFTSFLVAIISIIISNIIPHVITPKAHSKKNIQEKVFYKILPIYKQQNIYKIKLTIVVSTKVMKIVQIIFDFIRINKKVNNTAEEISIKKLKVKPV
ncbi:MAG: hypothetical protein ACI4VQ_06150 [Clostridia bacterium]